MDDDERFELELEHQAALTKMVAGEDPRAKAELIKALAESNAREGKLPPRKHPSKTTAGAQPARKDETCSAGEQAEAAEGAEVDEPSSGRLKMRELLNRRRSELP